MAALRVLLICCRASPYVSELLRDSVRLLPPPFLFWPFKWLLFPSTSVLRFLAIAFEADIFLGSCLRGRPRECSQCAPTQDNKIDCTPASASTFLLSSSHFFLSPGTASRCCSHSQSFGSSSFFAPRSSSQLELLLSIDNAPNRRLRWGPRPPLTFFPSSMAYSWIHVVRVETEGINSLKEKTSRYHYVLEMVGLITIKRNP